jgi:hypothetical protein
MKMKMKIYIENDVCAIFAENEINEEYNNFTIIPNIISVEQLLGILKIGIEDLLNKINKE